MCMNYDWVPMNFKCWREAYRLFNPNPDGLLKGSLLRRWWEWGGSVGRKNYPLSKTN